LAECTVNSEASPQFNKLREYWKRKGFPQIDKDLADAFAAISKDILAVKANRVQAGPLIEVYKYRQNSRDIKRGSSYGWRIIALFERRTATMYPIIVHPKTAYDKAGDDAIAEDVKEIRQILGYCISPECDGTMTSAQPLEQTQDGYLTHTKMKCLKCGSIQWAAA
jgi:hypothetical protein